MISETNYPWPSAVHYLIASRRAEVAALQQLRQLVQLAIVLGGLIHALQRERGAGSIYLGSSGQRFAELYQRMQSETEQQLALFRNTLNSPCTQEVLQQHNRALNDLALIIHQLDQRMALREATRALTVEPEQLHSFHTDLISSLLSVIFSAADTASEANISRALTALFHFILGKEQAGQERAIGGVVLARGASRGADTERIQLLIEGQQSSFETFVAHACEEVRTRWQQLDSLPCMPALVELRQRIIHSGSPQAGANEPDKTESSAEWFAQCTQRIDAMQDIERLLEQHLDRTTAQRLAQAEQELSEYQADINSGVATGLSHNLRHTLPLDTTTLDNRLQQPLFALLHDQRQRLHKMEEELQQVRGALEERKLIDRAKALLIRHRGMKEEQAHLLLRRTAMNQSRKLADVAKAVIAMVDMLDESAR